MNLTNSKQENQTNLRNKSAYNHAGRCLPVQRLSGESVDPNQSHVLENRTQEYPSCIHLQIIAQINRNTIITTVKSIKKIKIKVM